MADNDNNPCPDGEDFILNKDSLPEGPLNKNCDTESSMPEGEPFVEPAPCPALPAAATVIPTPLSITNDEVTLSCPSGSKTGPVGLPATVAAGTFTEQFHFPVITDITSSQLTYIASASAGERAELADPATNTARIIQLTGFTTTQAVEFNASITAIVNTVAQLANELAFDLLDCVYENQQYTETCFPAALTNADKPGLPTTQQALVNNPVTIAAGTFTSAVSQDEADRLAEDLAQRQLRCLYGNASRTRTCLDIGYTEAVPADDQVADTLDGEHQVGTYTVSQNTIFSSTSTAEANAIADALAESNLNCIYPNQNIIITCGGEGLVTGDLTDGPPIGNILTGKSGQTIDIPAGYLYSRASTADADAQARAIGLDLLECWVCNDAVTETCPSDSYVDKDGVAQNKEASVTASPLREVTTGACLFRSTISKVDANDAARDFAFSQLRCVYCNPEIVATCVPPAHENTVITDLSLYSRDTWSVDATSGVNSDVFCCPGTGGAQNCYEIGDGVASVPIDVKVNETDCRYGNDAVTSDCTEFDSGGDNLYGPGYNGVPAVELPADVFFVGESSATPPQTAKELATSLAQSLVDASRVCYWGNTEQSEACPNPEGTRFHSAVITPENLTTVTISADTVISFTSQTEADTLAQTIAKSRLSCIYCNDAQTGNPCAEGLISLQDGAMSECQITSPESTTDANTTAKAIADALTVCLNPADVNGAVTADSCCPFKVYLTNDGADVKICEGSVNGVAASLLPTTMTKPANGTYFYVNITCTGSDVSTVSVSTSSVFSPVTLNCKVDPPLPYIDPYSGDRYPEPTYRPSIHGNLPAALSIPIAVMVNGNVVNLNGCSNIKLTPITNPVHAPGVAYSTWDASTGDDKICIEAGWNVWEFYNEVDRKPVEYDIDDGWCIDPPDEDTWICLSIHQDTQGNITQTRLIAYDVSTNGYYLSPINSGYISRVYVPLAHYTIENGKPRIKQVHFGQGILYPQIIAGMNAWFLK